jgi:hypothetical protein
MISLIQLILDDIHVWITRRGLYGGKNSNGSIRYFTTKEKANKFSRGIIRGEHPGGPEPKQYSKKKKEKLDDRPEVLETPTT